MEGVDAVDGTFGVLKLTILVERESQQKFGSRVACPPPVTNKFLGYLHISLHAVDILLNVFHFIELSLLGVWLVSLAITLPKNPLAKYFFVI